jgi:aspartate racemase
MKQVLGILGGMGPLASAEFLKTIYDFNIGAVEQESPVCILYSDPTIPDRTEAIRNGIEGVLLEQFIGALETLCRLGADKIVIACVTIHYLLPRVPLSLRQKVISLVDLIIDEIVTTHERHLLLCTSGSRKARLFQNQERWPLIEPQVVLMNDGDQCLLQDLIQKQIKANHIHDSLLSCFDELSKKYEVDSFIAGCTEIHLLVRRLTERGGEAKYRFVDPLMTVAKDLKRFVNGTVPLLQ